jgi:hypothetical protein
MADEGDGGVARKGGDEDDSVIRRPVMKNKDYLLLILKEGNPQ